MNKLDHTTLREYLNYDPETGVFTWRTPPKGQGIAIGSVAGNLQKGNRYWRVCVKGVRYPAHRLAWFYVHGVWPAQHIDHLNGVRDDNRIANLREATDLVNAGNQRTPRKNNPYLGVSWKTAHTKWVAQIAVNYTKKHLGYFDTPEEARDAYLEAKRKLHAGCTI